MTTKTVDMHVLVGFVYVWWLVVENGQGLALKDAMLDGELWRWSIDDQLVGTEWLSGFSFGTIKHTLWEQFAGRECRKRFTPKIDIVKAALRFVAADVSILHIASLNNRNWTIDSDRSQRWHQMRTVMILLPPGWCSNPWDVELTGRTL